MKQITGKLVERVKTFTTGDNISFFQVVKLFIMAIAAYTMAVYLNLPYKTLAGMIIFLFLTYLTHKKKPIEVTEGEKKVCVFLALFFSIILILGYHIHVDAGQTYTGLSDINYIVRYTWMDGMALFLIMYAFFIILKFLFVILPTLFHKVGLSSYSDKKALKKRDILICLAVFLIMWMPYLITYFPGFIFGDSLGSLYQARGDVALNNHHPVLYTLLIRLCLKIGNLFGGTTEGCAIYSLIQMTYMAFGISYMINWLYSRFSLNKIFRVALVIIYGFSPYIAQYTIAMWKDPIFSITIVLLSLKLSDAVSANHHLNIKDSIVIFFLMLLMTLSRNNGIYVAFAILAGCIVIQILRKKDKINGFILGITVAAILLSKLITGPIYSACGVSEASMAEKYGVFLNQMARVVVYDGNLSDADRAYLNQIMPLELYQSTYAPCCVDQFKWSSNFNGNVLRKDFMKVYFSVLLKNPKICFEAWELQTFGFWTINRPEINELEGNIANGVPRNIATEYTDATDVFGIQFATHEGDSLLLKAFPSNARCIPIGMIAWGMVFFLFVIFMKKRHDIFLIMLPSYGLIATLIIASPIHYWPRYGCALQFLLPLYVVLLLETLKRN